MGHKVGVGVGEGVRLGVSLGAHDVAELLFGAPKAPGTCSHFVMQSFCCEVTVAKRLFSNFVKYAEPESRSDCTTRRRGEAASFII